LLILGIILGSSPTAFAGQESAPGGRPARETLSLNGTWKIAFDTENAGKDQHWFEHFPTATTPIRVPSVWNEIRPNY
jgi:beta-galactosidase/beta-glucuronidase